MGADKPKDPRYLLLQQGTGWLAESEWPLIMGAVVKNPWNPIDAYTPKDATNNYEPGQVKDGRRFSGIHLSKQKQLKSKGLLDVPGVGQLCWQKSSINALDLGGRVVHVKRLGQAIDYFDQLMLDDDVCKQKVLSWLEDKSCTPSLVVGMLLCKETVALQSADCENQFKFRADLPVSTATAAMTGVPTLSDLKAEGATQYSKGDSFDVAAVETMIIAIEVKTVKLRKGKLCLVDKVKAPISRTLGYRHADSKDEDIDEDGTPMQSLSTDTVEYILPIVEAH